MEKFNYAKYFDEYKVFDISNKEDIEPMKAAVKDAYKIERYFFNKIPNMDNFRWIIAFSFKLAKNLKYEDRINYIRGMVYCMRYINLDDIENFKEDVCPITESTIIMDLPTIFGEKDYNELKEGDFFDDDLVSIEYLKTKTEKRVPIFLMNEIEEVDDEDEEYEEEYDDEEDIKFNTVNTMEIEISFDEEDTDQKNKVMEYLENLSSNIVNINSNIEQLNYDDKYEDVSPDEKINNFKNNFKEFIRLSLMKKDIPLFTKNSYGENNVSREAIYVIKGMDDWFNYAIHILETLYIIGPEDVKKYMHNFTDFI